MDRSKKVADLRSLFLIAAEPRHAYRRSQLPGLRLLFARDLKCTLETGLRLCHVRLRQKQCDFSGNAIDLGFVPSLLRRLHCGHCLPNAAPAVLELTDLRTGSCQI